MHGTYYNATIAAYVTLYLRLGKDEVTSSNLVSSSKKHLKSSDFGCFLLISATFGTDAVLRIFVDHIKYHRQNETEFPT